MYPRRSDWKVDYDNDIEVEIRGSEPLWLTKSVLEDMLEAIQESRKHEDPSNSS